MRIRLLFVAMLAMLLTTLPGCSRKESASASTESSDGSEVVGYLGDEKITMAELEIEAASELARLKNERYEMLRKTLDDLVTKKLLTKEAAAKNVSEQELFKAEIADKLTPPTDGELQGLWEQLKANPNFANQPFETFRARLEQEIMNRKRQARVQEYLQQLKAQAQFRSVLDPPRFEINIPAGEPSKGPDNAPVTMVEFSDFDCPFCKRSYPVVEQLLTEYGDRIRFVYRDFPLAAHQRAVPASQAARCAAEQDKYWPYFKNLMEQQGNLGDEDLKKRATDLGLDADRFNECYVAQRYTKQVESSFNDGKALGVTGTPTFFINGRMLVGQPTYESLKDIVEEELARSSS